MNKITIRVFKCPYDNIKAKQEPRHNYLKYFLNIHHLSTFIKRHTIMHI